MSPTSYCAGILTAHRSEHTISEQYGSYTVWKWLQQQLTSILISYSQEFVFYNITLLGTPVQQVFSTNIETAIHVAVTQCI